MRKPALLVDCWVNLTISNYLVYMKKNKAVYKTKHPVLKALGQISC